MKVLEICGENREGSEILKRATWREPFWKPVTERNEAVTENPYVMREKVKRFISINQKPSWCDVMVNAVVVMRARGVRIM